MENFTCVVIGTIAAVVSDESFNIPSPSASAAIRTASALSEFLKKEEAIAQRFASELYKVIIGCLPPYKHSTRRRKSGVQREKMWRAYHGMRTSDLYNKLWKDIITLGFLNTMSSLLLVCGKQAFSQANKSLLRCYHYFNTKLS